MKTLEKIKEEILKSKNLDEHSKVDAVILLDLASLALPLRDATSIIRVLEDLYQEVTEQEHKEVLLTVIKEYKSRILQLSYKYPEEYLTLRQFLKSLNIDTSNIDEDKLNLRLSVGIDDGMGYTPNGFQDVISSYLDPENDDIKIWI